MRIVETKKFRKQIKKLNPTLKQGVKDRLGLFSLDKLSSILNIHKLHGEYKDCSSLNITGDMRLVFKEISNDTIFLIAIGTHHDLYE